MDPRERALGERLGLPIEPRRDRLSFDLPCPRLRGSVCTVYRTRPTACGVYECRLLQRYKAGELSLKRALELVADAKTSLAELRKVMLPGQSLKAAREECRAKSDNWTSNPKEGRTNLMRHLRMMALNVLLDRNFRSDADGQFTAMK